MKQQQSSAVSPDNPSDGELCCSQGKYTMLEGHARVIFVCDVCIYKEITTARRNISHCITAAQIFNVSKQRLHKGLLPNQCCLVIACCHSQMLPLHGNDRCEFSFVLTGLHAHKTTYWRCTTGSFLGGTVARA
jgi:hypothetical protein